MSKSENIEMRKRNYRNRVLSIVRNNENVSRFDIKKMTRYSMTTTLSIVDEMISEGYLIESGIGESTGGRKPIWLKIRPDGAYFLGIEFYAQNISAVILDLTGEIVYTHHLMVPIEMNTSVNMIMLIKQEIRLMIDSLKSKARIMGIGIGTPGYMDTQKGISLNYTYIKNWENVNLKQLIEDEFQINTYIENSINVMALAYEWLEFGGYTKSLTYMCVRAGVRISNIINGRLLEGRQDAAGEIDHYQLAGSDKMCYCGQKGCLVNEISEGAILSKAFEGIQQKRFHVLNEIINGDYSMLTMDNIKEAYKKGDADVKMLFEETAGYVGDVLASAVMFYDPDKIVISHEIAKCDADSFVEKVTERISHRCLRHNIGNMSIEINRYGKNIGAIGAATLVMQNEIGCTEEREK